MGLISFFSGAAIATFLAFVLSKRSTRKLNNAIKSESLVTAKVPEDQLERFMDALDLLPIGIVIVVFGLVTGARNIFKRIRNS